MPLNLTIDPPRTRATEGDTVFIPFHWSDALPDPMETIAETGARVHLSFIDWSAKRCEEGAARYMAHARRQLGEGLLDHAGCSLRKAAHKMRMARKVRALRL